MPSSLRRAALLLIASCFAALPASAQTPTGVTSAPPLTDALRAVLQDSLNDYMRSAVGRGFSGVVLIARGDDVLLHDAFSSDARINRSSRFGIGSVTKPLTAAAVLRLQEQEKLRLGDPLWRHLTGVPADKRHIAIHHLLTHTSGIGTEYAVDGVADRDAALRMLLALPLEHDPGTAGYSNDGYNLLAILIEVASGRTYEEFMRDEVLTPAGMNDAVFWGAPSVATSSLAPVRREPADSIAAANWGYRGSTGILATAEDLFRWQRALQTGALLSESSRQVTFVPHVQFSDDEGYGYGWMVARTGRGTRLFFHNGAESGPAHYAGVRRYADEDVIAVILSNADEDLTWEVERDMVRIYWRIVNRS